MRFIVPRIFIFFCPFSLLSSISSEHFTETLLINPLPNGDLFSLFNFTVTTFPTLENSDTNAHSQHPILIPRLLQHLANQFDISDLRLSLAQGFWRPRLWGTQLPGAEIPSGNEIIAKFATSYEHKSYSEAVESEKLRWSRLVHTINGLFCTSMLLLVPQHTSNPKLVLHEKVKFEDDPLFFGEPFWKGERWFWGTLGGESVCTENIKAWKNLLPCKQNGIVSLMDPIPLLSAKFHAISLKFAKRSEWKEQWHFSLLAQTVHSGEMIKDKAEKGLFLLQSLFGRKLITECPIATKSCITVSQNEIFGLNQANTSSDTGKPNFVAFSGLQHANKIGTFRLQSPNFHALQKNSKSILVHSHIKSVNQIGGRISTQIMNPLPIPLTNALFAHQIPWHLRIFLHTLDMKCRTSSNGTQKNLFELSAFSLARDRGRPLLMELRMNIPAESKCTVDVSYEAAFLRIADFPPDASSGIFVPGALLQISLEHNPQLIKIMRDTFPFPLDLHDDQWLRVFGEPLLVLLPIPDFSMPFNVICLVCTAIAIYYGNAIALSTKLMVPIPKKELTAPAVAAAQLGILGQIRHRIETKFGGIYQRILHIFRRQPHRDEKED